MNKQRTTSSSSALRRNIKTTLAAGALPAFILLLGLQSGQAGATWDLNPKS